MGEPQNLQAMLENLTFDEVEVKTDLAKAYLRNNFGKFKSLGSAFRGSEKTVKDSYGNEIKVNLWPETALDTVTECKNIVGNINELIKKIEENTELFAQLEYLIRKRPVELTRNCDIKLLVQYLKICVEKFSSHSHTSGHEMYLKMKSDSPLATLGCFGRLFKKDIVPYKDVQIISSVDTAVVCYLFTSLCYDAGLKCTVSLVLLEDSSMDDERLFDLNIGGNFGGLHKPLEMNDSLMAGGCVGVVTEYADVDSAVDAFLRYSNKNYGEWRWQRLYVQESVGEIFKQALAARGAESRAIWGAIPPHYEPEEGTMVAELYRTSLELSKLLAGKNILGTSIWSAVTSNSFELAFSLSSPFIWINEHLSLHGPKEAALAFYSQLEVNDVEKSIHLGTQDAKELLKVHDSWLKLPYEVRFEKLYNALNSYKDSENVDQKEECIKALLSYPKPFSFTENGKICISDYRPVGVVLASEENYFRYYEAVASMLYGNAVIDSTHPFLSLYLSEHLKKLGMPIVAETDLYHSPNDGITLRDLRNAQNLSTVKVVRTSFGTIFAN